MASFAARMAFLGQLHAQKKDVRVGVQSHCVLGASVSEGAGERVRVCVCACETKREKEWHYMCIRAGHTPTTCNACSRSHAGSTHQSAGSNDYATSIIIVLIVL